MRKLLWGVAIVLLGWMAWQAAFDRDSILYWRARMAAAWLSGDDPSLVTRFTDTTGRRTASPPEGARVGVFIAYGQSNSANFGMPGHAVSGPVFNFLDGATYAYEDPALGADGFGGSVWGRVGEGLVATGRYDAVVFASTGFSSRMVGHLAEGALYDYFRRQYQGLLAAYGHVDGVLFHQGEENHRDRTDVDYAADFAALYGRMRADGLDAPFYLSQASYCDNSSDDGLIDTQDRIIRDTPGVLRGPNTDLLTDDRYRRDRCHFSAEGLDAFASQWVEALGAASEE